MDLSNDSFWTSGWVYARVQHQIAFIYNGLLAFDFYICLSKFCIFDLTNNSNLENHLQVNAFLPAISMLQVRLLWTRHCLLEVTTTVKY